MRNIARVVFWMTGGLLTVRLTFSYIDPNTGGLIFQLLAAILASFTGIFLFFSRQIRFTAGRLRRRLSGTQTSNSAQDSDIATEDRPNEE